MYRDVEEMLTRELREVADHVTVPPLPELPAAPPPARFAWQPMLVAAALVLVALATVASLLRMDDGRSPQPAPRPTEVVTDDATEAVPDSVPTAAPVVPYIVDGFLYVGGEQVEGTWSSVTGVDTGWWAVREDGTYWWGYGDPPSMIQVDSNQPPAVNPSGTLIAGVEGLSGQGRLYAFEPEPSRESIGGPPIPVVDDDGAYTSVAAVTDTGLVITRGTGTALVWRPLFDNGTVPVPEGFTVLESTLAGLVVVEGASDGTQGRVSLAEMEIDDGEISPVAELPNYATLDASGDWVAWVPPGVIEGDVATYDEIQVRRISGGDEGVLVPPDGFEFRTVGDFAFEDNQFLVAPVTDGEEQGWARCSPALQECVLLDTPSANQ